MGCMFDTPDLSSPKYTHYVSTFLSETWENASVVKVKLSLNISSPEDNEEKDYDFSNHTSITVINIFTTNMACVAGCVRYALASALFSLNGFPLSYLYTLCCKWLNMKPIFILHWALSVITLEVNCICFSANHFLHTQKKLTEIVDIRVK